MGHFVSIPEAPGINQQRFYLVLVL